LDDDIRKDCVRTFIDGENDAENKRHTLSTILKIYGRAHPEIGYTQGI
jgi:Rab-GTPase-TBC domain